MVIETTTKVCKFETSMLARFRPTSAGVECRIEEENKFFRGTTGVGEASNIDGEEKVYNLGVIEEKVCTGGAAEAEEVCTGGAAKGSIKEKKKEF
jgi:hypothetical protein